MAELLKPGQVFSTVSSNLPCTIEFLLGSGGQGEVYRSRLENASVALKWYFAAAATAEQREILEALVRKGAPNDRFLWPLDLVASPDVPGFGYVMPLRAPRFRSLFSLMKRTINPAPTFRALTTTGLELSHSYLLLHSRGWCYRDISFGNVFFDPASGEALICDNDNVVVNGDKRTTIVGTPRFMAPEVVRGQALPSTQTDLYSLSVLLFYMFVSHSPLEGKRELRFRALDADALTRLYGIEPVFIFDPDDESNRPDPQAHPNALAFWPVYPQFLRDLFTQAFTSGLKDPFDRVQEGEWRQAMARLRDLIFYCSHCGAESFFEDASTEGEAKRCWSCQQDLERPLRIKIGRRVVALNHDTQLYPHHTEEGRDYDFSEPTAAVARHPTDPRIWGLKNLSSQKWVCTTRDGSVQDVPPGRSISLALGTKVSLGRVVGEIQK